MQRNDVALDSNCTFTIPLGTVTLTATGAGSVAAVTVTLPPGSPALKSTDMIVAFPASQSGLNLGYVNAFYVSATSVAINTINPTAGSLTWPAMAWTLLVIR